jgi:hypothetical protein
MMSRNGVKMHERRKERGFEGNWGFTAEYQGWSDVSLDAMGCIEDGTVRIT